jgi:hypothetical protein
MGYFYDMMDISGSRVFLLGSDLSWRNRSSGLPVRGERRRLQLLGRKTDIRETAVIAAQPSSVMSPADHQNRDLGIMTNDPESDAPKEGCLYGRPPV